MLIIIDRFHVTITITITPKELHFLNALHKLYHLFDIQRSEKTQPALNPPPQEKKTPIQPKKRKKSSKKSSKNETLPNATLPS